MYKHTKLCTGLVLAFGGLAIAPGIAMAQETKTLQRVEVTGSSIRRADVETASPVQVISKEDLAQSGKGTVAEYLQTLTADSQVRFRLPMAVAFRVLLPPVFLCAVLVPTQHWC